VKFLLYNLFGGLIMLAALVGLYVATSTSTAFTGGTFDFRRIAEAVSTGDFAMAPLVAHTIFGGFLFAFAIKAPLWPLHRWLPKTGLAYIRGGRRFVILKPPAAMRFRSPTRLYGHQRGLLMSPSVFGQSAALRISFTYGCRAIGRPIAA
jgi:hypothetical protein